MAPRIPVNIVTGPLGAGKSTAVLHLLRHHSDGNWAVLVNEMGDVGIDALIIGADGKSELVAEIAGGCICCANGVPLQVCLTRLLRRRPSRVLIEPSGIGHISTLADILARPPLGPALDLRAVVCVVPCDRHDALWAAADNYKDMVHAADALVLNRRDVDASATARAEAWARDLFPPKPAWNAARGAFAVALLDGARDAAVADAADDDDDDESGGPVMTWTHPNGAKRVTATREGFGFVGFRFTRAAAPCAPEALDAALSAAVALPRCERLKGVFRTTLGWTLAQWVRGDAAVAREPVCRAAENRLQLIIGDAPPPPDAVARLETVLFAALHLS